MYRHFNHASTSNMSDQIMARSPVAARPHKHRNELGTKTVTRRPQAVTIGVSTCPSLLASDPPLGSRSAFNVRQMGWMVDDIQLLTFPSPGEHVTPVINPSTFAS